MHKILSTLFCLSCIGFPAIASAADVAELWQALRSGEQAGMLRHALAPGNGDPDSFAIGDCSTQRNLSDEGREQAKRIGKKLRENGITEARVFSSQWCRCMETAELLGLGPVQPLPILNSFYQRSERRKEQTQALREWLGKQTSDIPTILVTHQVNITAVTGIYPASGELVVVGNSLNGSLGSL